MGVRWEGGLGGFAEAVTKVHDPLHQLGARPVGAPVGVWEREPRGGEEQKQFLICQVVQRCGDFGGAGEAGKKIEECHLSLLSKGGLNALIDDEAILP